MIKSWPVVRSNCYSLIVLPEGVLCAALSLVHVAEVSVRFCDQRVYLDDVLERRLRLQELCLPKEEHSVVVLGLRLVEIEGRRGLELLSGLIGLPHLPIQ